VWLLTQKDLSERYTTTAMNRLFNKVPKRKLRPLRNPPPPSSNSSSYISFTKNNNCDGDAPIAIKDNENVRLVSFSGDHDEILKDIFLVTYPSVENSCSLIIDDAFVETEKYNDCSLHDEDEDNSEQNNGDDVENPADLKTYGIHGSNAAEIYEEQRNTVVKGDGCTGVIEEVEENDDDDDDDDDGNDGDDDYISDFDKDDESLYDSSLGNDRVDRCSAVVNILKDKGIERHYSSLAGGGLRATAIKYIIQRTAMLLIWTHDSMTQRDLPLVTKEVLSWFFEVITTHYLLVEKFLTEYLDKLRRFSASTCINYICDFIKAITWFVWFREGRIQEFKIGTNDDRGILYLLQQLKKSLKPSLKKQRLANSLENMIAHRRFPVGGIAKLQVIMTDDIQWAYSIDPYCVSRSRAIYNQFLSILVSALYVFSPQGRVGGIQDIRISQYSALLHDGYTTSSNFKTVGKYLMQPITISAIVKKLLVSYKMVRDMKKNFTSEFFFLTFSGTPHDRLGRLITIYFHKKDSAMKVTTTVLRSMVESEANTLNRKGLISDGDLKSLQNINGHSEKTSEQYYIKQRTFDDVQSGNRIFERISENSISEKDRSERLHDTCQNSKLTPMTYVVSRSDARNTMLSSTQMDTENDINRKRRKIDDSASVSEPIQLSFTTPTRSDRNGSSLEAFSTSSAVNYPPIIEELDCAHNNFDLEEERLRCISNAKNNGSNKNINDQAELNWGLKHPEILDTYRKRNTWTNAELDYIGTLVAKLG